MKQNMKQKQTAENEMTVRDIGPLAAICLALAALY